MAKRVLTQLVSDISGDEISEGGGETIQFSYRGTSYTIDLTAKESAGFDKSIGMYLEHATKVGGRRASTGNSASPGDAKAVREWAKDQGIDIPSRGRIPAEVRAQYEAAN